jgi:hypothetical protein
MEAWQMPAVFSLFWGRKGYPVKYLNLISGPRNISTALMYSFAQRSDTTVKDEPFYAVYLSKSGAMHPGRDEVFVAQSHRADVVCNEIFVSLPKPVIFIKNMAHHIEVLDETFLDKVTNIFLIRDPTQIIASYAQVIETPVMRDIGIEYQHKLFFELKERGIIPVIIDSGLLLENPRSVLSALCDAVGISFEESMLSWPPGPKEYDGVWARYWYENVHRSSGFHRQSTSLRTLPKRLEPLRDEAMAYYQELLPFALKP